MFTGNQRKLNSKFSCYELANTACLDYAYIFKNLFETKHFPVLSIISIVIFFKTPRKLLFGNYFLSKAKLFFVSFLGSRFHLHQSCILQTTHF